MQSLSKKHWSEHIPASKKFLSRMFTIELNRRLNPELYDVVFEIPLATNDEGEPDVVVFNKQNGYRSIMALEICGKEEVQDMLIVARGLMEKHGLHHFFVYDKDSDKWYHVVKTPMGYATNSDPHFLNIALDQLGFLRAGDVVS